MFDEKSGGDINGECAVMINRLEAENAALREALRISVEAMRAPIDDWKGVVERHALDVAKSALTPNANGY
jgi:hypothetical protein